MAKVYLSCHHPDPANELAAQLTAAGHTVSSTWHTDPAPRPAADDAAEWSKNARRNFREIVKLAAQLTAAGHTVSSTWHTDPAPRPAADDAAEWSKNARRNFREIGNSDVLVLIASPDHLSGVKRVSGGKFVEAGYALARCARVVTLGGVENGMLYEGRVEHADDPADLLKRLAVW